MGDDEIGVVPATAQDAFALVKAGAAVVASLATVIAAVFAFGAWYGGNAKVWGSIESQVGAINDKFDRALVEQAKLSNKVHEHEWRLGVVERVVSSTHGAGAIVRPGPPSRGEDATP